jgi:hypothetical protein
MDRRSTAAAPASVCGRAVSTRASRPWSAPPRATSELRALFGLLPRNAPCVGHAHGRTDHVMGGEAPSPPPGRDAGPRPRRPLPTHTPDVPRWDRRRLQRYLTTVGVAGAPSLEDVILDVRAEIVLLLEACRASWEAASFARDLIDAGAVVRVRDEHSVIGWAADGAREMRLIDRVAALLAADYLTRPADYRSVRIRDMPS